MRNLKPSPAVVLGVVSGVLVSLSYRAVQNTPFGYSGHSSWGWQGYAAALVLAGLGLAGLFPSKWRRVAVSLSLGWILSQFVPDFWREVNAPFRHMVPLPILLPFFELPVFAFFSFPPAFVGSFAGRRLSQTRAPRLLYVVSMLAAVAIAGALPVIDRSIRRRLEISELPALLQNIHRAEMAFHSSDPDDGFTCDPAALPSIGGAGWERSRRFEGDPPPRLQASLKVTHRYVVTVDCGEIGLWFVAHVIGVGSGMDWSVDQTGSLLRVRDSESTYRRRIETQEMPALLRRLHRAEIRYRDQRLDKAFTCDGARLPGLEKLRWEGRVLRVDNARAELHCGDATPPLTFRIDVEYGVPPLFAMSMDETGAVSGIKTER